MTNHDLFLRDLVTWTVKVTSSSSWLLIGRRSYQTPYGQYLHDMKIHMPMSEHDLEGQDHTLFPMVHCVDAYFKINLPLTFDLEDQGYILLFKFTQNPSNSVTKFSSTDLVALCGTTYPEFHLSFN